MRQRIYRKQPTSDARKNTERHVSAYHSNLKEKVEKLPAVILLSYCHPTDRVVHARAMYKDGLLIREEAERFFKVYETEED